MPIQLAGLISYVMAQKDKLRMYKNFVFLYTCFQTAVTHPSRALKSSVTLTWTAPAEGTGELTFL